MNNFHETDQNVLTSQELERAKLLLIYDLKSMLKENLLQLSYQVETYLNNWFYQKLNNNQSDKDLLIDNINRILYDSTYNVLLKVEEKINNFDFTKL
jgi:hypothetical protein